MTTSDRNDDQTDRNRQDGADSERRAASSPARQDHVEQQERQRDELSHQADHQLQPEDLRPDEAEGDRTGTARRSEEAAGQSPDENYRTDADRAYRRSRGE